MTTKRTEHDIKRQKIVTRVYVGLLTGKINEKHEQHTFISFFRMNRFSSYFTFVQYIEDSNYHTNCIKSIVNYLL